MSIRKEKYLDSAYVMLHPIRYRITKLLKESSKPLYVAQIAKKLGMSDKRKLISFHLSVLSEHGLVKSKYNVRGGPSTDTEGHPIVVNYYHLTKKAKDTISTFNL